ncbi:hypothetical protein BDZ94DRAFT_1252991, partial [Collybia nuda]
MTWCTTLETTPAMPSKDSQFLRQSRQFPANMASLSSLSLPPGSLAIFGFIMVVPLDISAIIHGLHRLLGSAWSGLGRLLYGVRWMYYESL